MLAKQWVGMVLVGAATGVAGSAMAMSAVRINAGGLGAVSAAALPAQLHLPAGSQLVADDIVQLDGGQRMVRMRQVYKGVEVYGRSVVVKRGPDNQVLNVNGMLERDLDRELASTTARLRPVLARRALQRELGQSSRNVRQGQAKLYIYPGDGQPARLVYQVSYLVGWGGHLSRPTALIDATTGQVIKHWNGLTTGNHRRGGVVDGHGRL